MIEFIIAFSAYILVGSLLAYRYRAVGVEEFMVAGRRLGGFASAMTYAATTYSAFMMVGLVGLVYNRGIGAFGFETSYLLGTLTILGAFALTVWGASRDRGWLSPSHMMEDLYGTKLASLLASSLYLVALVPYVTAQLLGIGSILVGAGLSKLVSLLTAAALILAWVVSGGMKSVAATDVFQGLWMIGSALLLLAFSIASFGVRQPSSEWASGWGPWTMAAFSIPWIFFSATNPQVVHRLFIIRSRGAVRRMVLLFTGFGLLYTVIVALLGLSASNSGLTGLPQNEVTPRILIPPIPIWAGSLVQVGIVAAAVSTANSIVHSVSTSLSTTLGRGERGLALAVASALVASSLALSLTSPAQIVELSVSSSLMLLPLAPVTLLGWAKPELARRVGRLIAAPILLPAPLIAYAMSLRGIRGSILWGSLGIPLAGWVLIISAASLALAFVGGRPRT